MKKEIKKRAKGAGRKPIDNKIKAIPIYIREKRLYELGGESNVRELVNKLISEL